MVSVNQAIFQVACVFLPNNFSYNERIVMGPGAHWPGFKTTKEKYIVYL